MNVIVANGNKENSKKLPNESVVNNSHINAAAAPKVSLKAREFGREITNATSSASNHGALGTKVLTLYPFYTLYRIICHLLLQAQDRIHL